MEHALTCVCVCSPVAIFWHGKHKVEDGTAQTGPRKKPSRDPTGEDFEQLVLCSMLEARDLAASITDVLVDISLTCALSSNLSTEMWVSLVFARHVFTQASMACALTCLM